MMTFETGTRKSPRLAQARILNKCCGAWPCAHAKCMYWPARAAAARPAAAEGGGGAGGDGGESPGLGLVAFPVTIHGIIIQNLFLKKSSGNLPNILPMIIGLSPVIMKSLSSAWMYESPGPTSVMHQSLAVVM
jgi:hypothetical protein